MFLHLKSSDGLQIVSNDTINVPRSILSQPVANRLYVALLHLFLCSGFNIPQGVSGIAQKSGMVISALHGWQRVSGSATFI